MLGSGAILTEVIKAAEELMERGVDVVVCSVTSWSELAREGRACAATQSGAEERRKPFVTGLLESCAGPIVAASDYVHAVPESIRAYIPAGRSYVTLGTDGFGRSDTRAALRQHFGVDAKSIVTAALTALGDQPG